MLILSKEYIKTSSLETYKKETNFAMHFESGYLKISNNGLEFIISQVSGLNEVNQINNLTI